MTRRARALAPLTAALAALVGVLVVAPVTEPLVTGPLAGSSTAQAQDSGVIFPLETRTNPDHAPYVVRVSAPEGSTATAVWRGAETPLPGLGEQALPLTEGRGYPTVRVCPPADSSEPGCRTFYGPEVTVVTRLGVYTRASVMDPDQSQIYVGVEGARESDPVALAWRLEDAAGATVVEGQRPPTAAGPRSDNGYGTVLDLGLPGDLPSGRYRLTIDAEAETPEVGRLAGTWSGDLELDDEVAMTFALQGDTVYPVTDGYLDALPFRVESDPDVFSVRLDVVAQDGTVVGSDTFDVREGLTEGAVRGRTGKGLFDEGAYTVRATVRDRVGNEISRTVPMTVSRDKLTWTTWRRTLPAKRAVVEREVGRCSSLVSPAPGRGAGSLGFRSQSRCTKASESEVVIRGNVVVPQSVTDQYRKIQLSATGGRALGERSGYLVGYAYSTKNRETERKVLGFQWDRYDFTALSQAAVFDREGAQPRVWWSFGLTEGSRYDLGTVSVRLQYLELR